MILFTRFAHRVRSFLPILAIQELVGEGILTLLPQYLPIVKYVLKNHIGCQYKMLTALAGVDFVGHKYRFSVAYELLSITFNNRLRLKTYVNEITPVPSITNIFPNANWWEREVWDMYGIFFERHSDLRRILSDYGFEGYPMRKDFPLYGFLELRFDEQTNRICGEPVEFAQEMRVYTFGNPW